MTAGCANSEDNENLLQSLDHSLSVLGRIGIVLRQSRSQESQQSNNGGPLHFSRMKVIK